MPDHAGRIVAVQGIENRGDGGLVPESQCKEEHGGSKVNGSRGSNTEPCVEFKDVTFGYDDHIVFEKIYDPNLPRRAGNTHRTHRSRKEYDL